MGRSSSFSLVPILQSYRNHFLLRWSKTLHRYNLWTKSDSKQRRLCHRNLKPQRQTWQSKVWGFRKREPPCATVSHSRRRLPSQFTFLQGKRLRGSPIDHPRPWHRLKQPNRKLMIQPMALIVSTTLSNTIFPAPVPMPTSRCKFTLLSCRLLIPIISNTTTLSAHHLTRLCSSDLTLLALQRHNTGPLPTIQAINAISHLAWAA